MSNSVSCPAAVACSALKSGIRRTTSRPGTCSAFLLRGERGERRSRRPRPGRSTCRWPRRRPRRCTRSWSTRPRRSPAIAALTCGSIRTVTDTSAPPARAACTAAAAVERRVHPHQHRPARAEQPAGGLDRVGDQPFRAARRAAASPCAAAAPRSPAPRCAVVSGGQQRVQPADPGVAEPGALLGVAVDLDDRVVDIDQRVPAGRRRPAAPTRASRVSPASPAGTGRRPRRAGGRGRR